MIRCKQILYTILALLTFQTCMYAQEQEIPNELRSDKPSATVQHQHAKKIAALQGQVTDMSQDLSTIQNDIKTLQISNLAMYTMLLTGEIDRLIVFGSDVEIIDQTTPSAIPNLFKVIDTDQVAIFAPEDNKVELTAGSFSGITESLYDNLTLTTGAASNAIKTHTVVDGSLTVSKDITIEGNLVVNGALTVDTAVTLQVNGDLILDGQCGHTLINQGTISATGNITIQNYYADGNAILNLSDMTNQSVIRSTGLVKNTITFKNNTSTSGGSAILNSSSGAITLIETPGNIIFENNTGTNTVTNTNNVLIQSTGSGDIIFKNNTSTGTNSADAVVKNGGSNVCITTAGGDIVIKNNTGIKHVVYNDNFAKISTTLSGTLSIKNNYSSEGIALLNSFGASLSTVDGDTIIEQNESDLNTITNMNAGVITSTGKGSIYIKNNYSKNAIALDNTDTSSIIQTTTGDIIIDDNKGATAGVSNMTNASINVTTMGSIYIKNNHSAGAHGVYNVDSATIETTAAGCIVFEKNSGEVAGVKNENSAEINAFDYILFNGNKGRTDSGVHNDRGSIEATNSKAFITFKYNTGRDYGVRNHATAAGTSNVRTTDATAYPNNQTKILFIGNTGGIQDTYNSNGSGTSNMIAGAASPTVIGNGTICYDSQRNVNVVSGTVNPEPRICAKDEYLEAPVIESLNVDESINKIIVFDQNVNVTLDGTGALSLGGITNGLTVLAHLTDPAIIQVRSTATDIQPSSFANVTLTTSAGSNEITGSVILSSGNFTVNDDLTINGNLTVKGGSLTVATGTTLTINGDLIANGLHQDKQVQINGTGAIIAENVTIQNYDATSGPALTVSGTLTAQCGAINIHDMTSTMSDAINITGTVEADGDINFLCNSSTTGTAVTIGSMAIIYACKSLYFIKNTGPTAGVTNPVPVGATVESKAGFIVYKDNISPADNSDLGTITAYLTTPTTDIKIHSINNDVNIMAGVDVDIDATNNFEATGATGATVEATATDAIVTVQSTGTGGDVSITADDTIALTGATFKQIEGSLIHNFDIASSSATLGASAPSNLTVAGSLTVDAALTVNGDLIVTGDLDIDENLTVHGNLLVCDGSVNLAATKTLTVTGNIIFDGKGNDHTVTITGDITNTAGTSPNTNNISIKNYSTSAGSAVTISGKLYAYKDILITNNNSSAQHGVHINSNEPIQAQEIQFINNVSSAAGDTYGVYITTPNTSANLEVTSTKDMHFTHNEGGSGMNAKGVYIIGFDGDDQVILNLSNIYITTDCSGNTQAFEMSTNTSTAHPFSGTIIQHVNNNGCPAPIVT